MEAGFAQLRPEEERDRLPIRKVNEAAFGSLDEADLVDNLRAEGAVLLSLVAEVDDQIAGHILFSRMTVETWEGAIDAVSLAPVAVLPEFQRCGIGGVLIRRGLDELRKLGERIVIVLGHPEYYTRFGFSVAMACTLASPFPPEAYMALELEPGALAGIHGTVRYPAAFGL